MAGYEGKLLEVNLTTGDIKTSTVDKETLGKFIGGSFPDLSGTPLPPRFSKWYSWRCIPLNSKPNRRGSRLPALWGTPSI
jgi:hypothetical protein